VLQGIKSISQERDLEMLDIKLIAKLCHTANKAICEAANDFSQVPWESAEQWQRDSAIKGVQFRLDNPSATAQDQHDAWSRDKIADGWVFGETKDPVTKTHPCLVDYDQLPYEQRVKDYVFKALVEVMAEAES
jgi:predicted RecB family nuclease